MKPASAPSYDLFKTIVTVILAVILLLMLLRGCATISAAPIPAETAFMSDPTEVDASVPVQTEAVQVPSTPETLASSPTPTAIEVTTTIATTPSATSVATESPTTVLGTATPSLAQSATCNTSVPSRLNVGQNAEVLQRLNMREDASIDATIIQTNPTRTQVEIIGGPVCTPVGDRAYLWWQIRLAGGTEGWSAEAPLNEASYLLEPVP